MPDRKEPRLELGDSKPASNPVERPATPAVTPSRPAASNKPETPAAPSGSTSSVPTLASRPTAAETPRSGSAAGRSSLSAPVAASAGTGGSGSGQGGGYEPPPFPPRHEPEPLETGGFPILAALAGLLAVIGLVFGGWQYQRAEQQQQSMQLLADRVQELEIRLSATGQDLSEAGSTFTEKLKWADDEIRKLWRLANNEMRPNITALQEQTKTLTERLTRNEGRVTEGLAAVQKSVTDQLQAGRALQEQFEALKREVDQAAQRLTEVTLTTSTLDQRLREVDRRNQLNELQRKVEALEKQVAAAGMPPELQQKLAEQDELLASLEASRGQLVSRVTRLMDEVRELQQAR